MAFLNKKSEESSEPTYKGEILPEHEVSPLKPEQEQKPEKQKEAQGKETEETSVSAPSAVASKTQGKPLKDPEAEKVEKIEHILEEDLEDLYINLDDQHKQLLKTAGESTALKINEQLSRTKTKVQSIFELIKSWLRLIPGVNKWFVVQESKIKTDKIIRINRK